VTSPTVIAPAGPNILVRIAWFFFVGWWLGAIVSGLAWSINLTIIGLPAGLWMLNRLPTVITLRPQEQQWQLDAQGNLRKGQLQRGFWRRALYFVLVGWWFSALWLGLAYACVCTLVLLPVAWWMVNRCGAVTTLYRS